MVVKNPNPVCVFIYLYDLCSHPSHTNASRLLTEIKIHKTTNNPKLMDKHPTHPKNTYINNGGNQPTRSKYLRKRPGLQLL